MAKKSNAVLKAVEPVMNVDLLKQIANDQVQEIDRDNAMPFLQRQPALIECGPVDMQTGKAPCRISEAGRDYLNYNLGEVKTAVENKTEFGIVNNAVLPPSKRGQNLGGGGRTAIYPFDKLEVGQTFFVPATDKRPDPLKVLGATVSSANMRYAVETGEMKTVTRAKRGEKNRAVRDENGAKIMETKQVPVYDFKRKFEIRGVEVGKSYGAWVAPANGVLIGRVR